MPKYIVEDGIKYLVDRKTGERTPVEGAQVPPPADEGNVDDLDKNVDESKEDI